MNLSSPSTGLETSALAPFSRSPSLSEELAQLKRELLQAEVRLAKARAGVAGAEADVKVLNSRMRTLTK